MPSPPTSITCCDRNRIQREDGNVYPEEKVKRITTRWAVLGLAIALLATMAACGGETGIEISDAWGRPSPSVATAGAFFMTITNNGTDDDALINASSPACGTVELHESFMNDKGAMAMKPVAGGEIALPAGGSAELKQGGLHVMCINKLEDFTEDAELELTLEFENAGGMTLDVEIREP
jgi:copper(I)-binding protein